MELTRLPKHSKIPTLVGISSFLLCIFTNAYAGSAKNTTSKSSPIILQKIKEFCKQYSSKKSKKDDCVSIPIQSNQTKDVSSEAFLSQAMAQPIEPTTDDKKSEIVLDVYEKIKDLYAYDPLAQAWVQIKSFKIISDCRNGKPIDLTVDGSPYINFWAYDLSNQTWHKVNLIPYLQQANTQINSDLSATATKKSVLPNHNNPSNNVAADALLEELLGVHTFIKPAHSEQSIWANFSFDFSIGAGAVLYSNRLEQMRLLQRQKQDYFFITKTNDVYKPNWFHDALNKVTHFDQSDRIEHGGSENAAFQGKGWGVPITLGIQYVFWQQLLVGVGREVVFNATNRLVHNDKNIKHKEYAMHKKWSAQGRWFAKCGWYAFSNEKRRFFGDIRLFHVHHFGRMFSTLVTFGPYLHQALAYNVGLGYEQQLTDYLSCTARLSIELQRFEQFSNKKSYNYNIQYKQPAIYLQVGLSMRSTKYNPFKHLKNKECQDKNQQLNGISKLEGLQDLLD